MARSLEVAHDDLRVVAAGIHGAPERSGAPPAAGVPSPAGDPVSVQAAHAFATRLAAIGARSVTAASRVRAAGDLVRADADTYAAQETLNSRALALGSTPAAGTVGVPRMAAVTPVAPQCPLPETATTPTDGKHIAELVHGGPGAAGLDEVARHLRSHAEELQGTAASLGSHALDLAAIWRSDAGAEAESTVCRLAADHADNGEHATTLAQRLMTQATDFQVLRRDVPAPGEFARVERQLQYAIAASHISSVYAGAVVTLRAELAELHKKATTAYASYTTKTEENIAGLDAPLDGEDTVRLVSNEIKLAPPDPAAEDSEDQPGDKPSVPSQEPGQIGPFPVPKVVEDAAKDLEGTPEDTPTPTGDVGGDLGDLLGGADDTAAEGKPQDGQPAMPGGENPAGLPPVLSQIPPPPDKATIDGQAAKVEAARQTLADAQAKLNDGAAVPDYTQGPAAGPGRGVSDPLSQALFDARAELTEQTRILNELNYASAAAGGPTAPVAPLPENADVQAHPPKPRQNPIEAFASGTADMYGTLADAGLAPDVGNMYDVATGWPEATPSERVQAGLDAAGLAPLPGSKWIGDGIGWGLDKLGVFRWMDGDVPTPHVDGDVPTPHVHGDVPTHHVPHAPSVPHGDVPTNSHGLPADRFDPNVGSGYASGNPHFPGRWPPDTPTETWVQGQTESGWKYFNRGDSEWVDYQLQSGGLERAPDGRVPEYMQVDPNTGKAVAFDSHLYRGGQEVFIDGKMGREGMFWQPESDYWTKRAEGDLATAQRQLAALPPGATLEWHVSTPQGAAALREMLQDNFVDGITVIYTPRP